MSDVAVAQVDLSTPDKSRPIPPRKRAADPKSYRKLRVSGDVARLQDVDGRHFIARRYRDIASAILVDQGGEEQCSESRKQLVRRFSAAACLAEQLEARLAKGEQIDITQHALLVSTMVRVANKIGIDRIPKDVETLEAHLASLKNKPVAEDSEISNAWRGK
jgi:hypothetical protein